MRATKTTKTAITLAIALVAWRAIDAVVKVPTDTCGNAVWLVVGAGIIAIAAVALALYVWRGPHPYGRRRSELHSHEHQHHQEH